MKILLLNPPHSHKIQRDQYCSLSVKADYYWPPIDLALHASVLQAKHQLKMIDAIAESLTSAKVIEYVKEFQPEAILVLSSVLSFKADLKLLEKIKNEFPCLGIFCGDIFSYHFEKMIELENVDAICLDYPCEGLLSFLDGQISHPGVVSKKNPTGVRAWSIEKSYSHPVIPWEIFPLKHYHSPHFTGEHSAFVDASTGCAHHCDYCVTIDVPKRLRSLDNLFFEIDELCKKKVTRICFTDLCFTTQFSRVESICKGLIDRGVPFRWMCLARPEHLTDQLLSLLKNAGCDTLMIGVETGDPDLLKHYHRLGDTQACLSALARCRAYRIKTFVSFILGFPEESKESLKNTEKFIARLEADFISINFFTPRLGSQFSPSFEKLRQEQNMASMMDSSELQRSFCSVGIVDLIQTRNRLYRKFYLRPRQCLRIVKTLASFEQFISFLKNCFTFVRKISRSFF